ncbi:MAG: transposase [Leptolyngbyaceae cyanobacterium CSU_1_4]|nr:transposase [Leptolyngbyaceae cyanobacterium CSU_1_4]
MMGNCQVRFLGEAGTATRRSLPDKTTGWSLSEDCRQITFTDKKGIGRVKMLGTRDLGFYSADQIKRVRLIRRADGYFVQFAVKVDRTEVLEPSGSVVGLDVGLESFYTDSNGEKVPNPRFYRKGQQALRQKQRRVSRKVKGSKNRAKARVRLAKKHLQISRQRKDHAIKLARCVISSNDVVVYENLRVRNMVKNHCLAKSINDAGWYQFRIWLEYFGKVFGRLTLAVEPAYTSQECSSCGVIVKKSLSTRTHVCECGCELDRDENAAINILMKGIGMRGHLKTATRDVENAWGELTSTLLGETLAEAS